MILTTSSYNYGYSTESPVESYHTSAEILFHQYWSNQNSDHSSCFPDHTNGKTHKTQPTYLEFSIILRSAALLILSSLTDINFSSLGWTGEKPSIPTFLFHITLKFEVSANLNLLHNEPKVPLRTFQPILNRPLAIFSSFLKHLSLPRTNPKPSSHQCILI